MKKFWGGFKRVLDGVGKVATIATLVYPPAAAIAGTVSVIDKAIAVAEEKFKEPGSGPQKLQWAIEVAQVNGDDIIRQFEQLTGKELADEESFEKAMTHLISFKVQIQNAFEKKQQ